MFSLNDSLSYYYFRESTDMRKGFDALCGMVRTQMQRNPLSGEVFIFMNRPRNTVKIFAGKRADWSFTTNGWSKVGLSNPFTIIMTKLTICNGRNW